VATSPTALSVDISAGQKRQQSLAIVRILVQRSSAPESFPPTTRGSPSRQPLRQLGNPASRRPPGASTRGSQLVGSSPDHRAPGRPLLKAMRKNAAVLVAPRDDCLRRASVDVAEGSDRDPSLGSPFGQISGQIRCTGTPGSAQPARESSGRPPHFGVAFAAGSRPRSRRVLPREQGSRLRPVCG